MRNRIKTFDAKNARVAEIFTLNSAACASHPATETFQAEKIALWILFCQRQKKRAVAASDIHFNRPRPGENGTEIKRPKIVFGHVLSGGD